MKKYMAAAVLISYIVLAAGCTGSASSQSESSLQTDSSTAEVTTSAAPTEQPEEVSETEAVPEPAETTAAQTEATQDTSAPEEQGGYIADWIYGTWSVISVNGQDYWEYAAQNDEDQEKMMIFTAQGVDITSGDRVLRTLNYRITDEGAEIRDTDGAVILMTYSPQDDTLTFTADGYTTVVKRGTNPKPAEN